MTSPRNKLLTVTALVAGLAAVPTAAQASTATSYKTPAPKVVAVSLETAPTVGDKTVALYFRTNTRIGRKANGKSLDAYAGVLQTGTGSVSTLRGGSTRYVTYLPKLRLKVGKKYAIEIVISGKTFNRTVTLKKGTMATAHGENIQ